MERLPWWLFILTGIYFAAFAVNSLLDSKLGWDAAWALIGLAVVVPAQLLAAYRLRRGVPLTQPLLRRKS